MRKSKKRDLMLGRDLERGTHNYVVEVVFSNDLALEN